MNHRGSALTEIDRAAGSLIRNFYYDARNLWFSLVEDPEMVMEDLTIPLFNFVNFSFSSCLDDGSRVVDDARYVMLMD